MDFLYTLLSIIQVILCIAIIVVILVQSSKSTGMGSALSGSADTFFGKNKGRSLDAILKKVTIALAITMGVVVLLLTLIASAR